MEKNIVINKHSSFYVRSSWPTKILDAISRNESIFSPNKELEAVDEIGVGRVMIKSMRYWANALGTPMLPSETENDFFKLCNVFGPPRLCRSDLFPNKLSSMRRTFRNRGVL